MRKMPREDWEDGLFVMRLLMSCYMAAEKGRKSKFPAAGLENFIPQVAKGKWNSRSVIDE